MKGFMNFVWIDMPNDFCDPTGTMFVPGADQDVKVAAKVVDWSAEAHVKHGLKVIHRASLDQHHRIHIAHGCMWVNENGEHPADYTSISLDDVIEGKWRAKFPHMQSRYVAYVQWLHVTNKPNLMIWPVHCQIASWGACIHPTLGDSLNRCEAVTGLPTLWRFKGTNIWTEAYSFVEAEVPDTSDPDTMIDLQFITDLAEAEMNIFGGEALDYCYKGSIVDTIKAVGKLPGHSEDEFIKRCILLRDATSAIDNVPGVGEAFVAEMRSRGMIIATSDELPDILLRA
jgi:nicotinamidase-related amidase